MGRTDQVLTGGFLSYNPLSTTMKAVLALLLVCLVQISFAEQEDIAADGASSDTNLLLQREVREAAKGNKGGCDKKCKNKRRQMKKKSRKRLRKQQKKNKKDQKSGRKNKTSKEGNHRAKKGGKKRRKNKKGKTLKGKNKGGRKN